MQTAVESEPARPAVLKSLSNESVHISREVSVVSSRAPTPSVIRSPVNELVPGVVSVKGPGAQFNRWNSRMSDKSWKQSRGISSQARQASQDTRLLDSNYESMRALADFLMTREPPPNNFMSFPSDDEESIHQLKRTAFRLFGKHKKRVKSPRLMQLPDSAVAAHTRSGARHIAISIPMQHDYTQGPLGSQAPSNPLRSHPTARPDSRGAVTVLKTVAEVRESASRYPTSDQQSHRAPVVSIRPTNSPLFPLQAGSRRVDPARIMSACRPDAMLQQRQPAAEPAPLIKSDSQRSRRSYIAVSPSQGTDPRHSNGTAYSQMSFTMTPRELSRQVSSASTAPSAPLISALQLTLPPRSSSISKFPNAQQQELDRSSKVAHEKAETQPPISPTIK